MKAPGTRKRDLLQNCAITLLSVSAAVLFLSGVLLSHHTGRLSALFDTAGSTDTTESADTLAAFPAPVRLAVTGAYGRYGNVALSTDNEAFSAPGSLLRETIGSAGSPLACTESEFRAALADASVYYDFLTPLPLQVIAALVGADYDGTAAARRLAAVDGGASVELYWSDGETFFRTQTSVSRTTLTELADQYALGNASFGYELAEDPLLAPYTLVKTGDTDAYPVLTASAGAQDDSLVLSALGFNPRTNSRYTESGGTVVVVEGDQTLRLRPDGGIFYDSGSGANAPSVSSSADPLHVSEAAVGCLRLLNRAAGSGGAETLYLTQALQTEAGWELHFDYQVKGVPVYRSDGVSAATARLSGSALFSLEFYARQYTPAAEDSLLLPLRQALALAGSHPGAELSAAYTDSGESRLTADWLAEG